MVTLLLLSFALSLDAFAVSITCGIKLNRFWIIKYLKIAVTFGLFQGLMPIGGYLIGHYFSQHIELYSGIISSTIFFILGLKTIYDLKTEKSANTCSTCACSNFKCLLSLGIATSIDAFLAGVVLAVVSLPIITSLVIIGLTTFAMSLLGAFIGYKSNRLLKRGSRYLAATILFVLSVKSLLL